MKYVYIKDTAYEKRTEKTKDLSYHPEVTKHDMDILEQKNAGIRKDTVDFLGKNLYIPDRNEAKKGNGSLGLNDEKNKLQNP